MKKLNNGKIYTYWTLCLVIFTAVILIIYFYRSGRKNEKETHVPVRTNLINIHENNAVVIEYIDFVSTNTEAMNPGHSYSYEAFSKLADATNAMAHEIKYDIKGDLDTAKVHINQIIKDPLENTHADNIKKGAVIITNILDNIQRSKYPELSNEMSELKIASDSINVNILTLNQKNTINDFLNKAADLLAKMN